MLANSLLFLALVFTTVNAAAIGWISDSSSACQIWYKGDNEILSVLWTGSCRNGKAHGDGKLVYRWVDDGKHKSSSYVGQMADGKRNGKGSMTNSKGSIWTGTYVDHELEGFATVVYDNGHIFEGIYVDGTRKGEGKYTWPDGSRFVGQWSGGKRNGVGVLYRSKGSVVVGVWEAGKRVAVIDVPGLVQGNTDDPLVDAGSMGISTIADIGGNTAALKLDQAICFGVPPLKDEQILRPIVAETELRSAEDAEAILDRAAVACRRARYLPGLSTSIQGDLYFKQVGLRLVSGFWSASETLKLLQAAQELAPDNIEHLDTVRLLLGWLKEQYFSTKENDVLLILLQHSAQLNLKLAQLSASDRHLAALAADLVYLVDVERGLGLPAVRSRTNHLSEFYTYLHQRVQNGLPEKLSPDDTAVVHAALGKIEMQRQRYKRASDWFGKAIETATGEPILSLYLALSKAYEGQQDLAARTFLRFSTEYTRWIRLNGGMGGMEYADYAYRDYYFELMWVLATGHGGNGASRSLTRELLALNEHFEGMQASNIDLFPAYPLILAAVQAQLGNFEAAFRENNRALNALSDGYSRRDEFAEYGRAYARKRIPGYGGVNWPRSGLRTWNGYDFFLPNQVVVLQSNYFQSLHFDDTSQFQAVLDSGQPFEQRTADDRLGRPDMINRAKDIANRHFVEKAPSFMPIQAEADSLVKFDRGDLWDALHQANNVAQVRYIIENGDPSIVDDLTKIIPAVNGMANALSLFDAVDLSGRSCSNCALENLAWHEDEAVVRLLISKGFGGTTTHISEHMRANSLIEPEKLRALDLALELGLLHPSASYRSTDTLIRHFVRTGDAGQVKVLLSHDVDLSLGSRMGSPDDHLYRQLNKVLDRRYADEPGNRSEINRLRSALSSYANSSGTRRGYPDSDIAIQSGQFRDGVLVKGTTIFRDGRTLSGTYDNDGRPDGRMVYADKNGVYGDVTYESGRQTGEEVLVQKSGTAVYQHRTDGRVDTQEYRQRSSKNRVSTIEREEFEAAIRPMKQAIESARRQSRAIEEDEQSALASIIAESGEYAGKCRCELPGSMCLRSVPSDPAEREAADRRYEAHRKACLALYRAGIYVGENEDVMDVLRNANVNNPSLDEATRQRIRSARAAVDEVDRLDALAEAKERERQIAETNLRRRQEEERQARLTKALAAQKEREAMLKVEAEERHQRWKSCVTQLGFKIEDVANWRVWPDC